MGGRMIGLPMQPFGAVETPRWWTQIGAAIVVYIYFVPLFLGVIAMLWGVVLRYVEIGNGKWTRV